jgi:membrane associated rhomboid family serine protease
VHEHQLHSPSAEEHPPRPSRLRGLALLAGGLRVTYALIAVNLIAFAAEEGQFSRSGSGIHGLLVEEAALDRFDVVKHHEYWRLVSSAFLHANVMHVTLNMLVLFVLGLSLEPMIGSLRFIVVYLTALLGGSFAALVVTNGWVVGASGAIFGLMGALAVYLYARGVNVIRSGLVPVIVLALLNSFAPHISVGAHVGGLLAGSVAALLLWRLDRRAPAALAIAACLSLCVLLAVASATLLSVGGSRGIPSKPSEHQLIERFVSCMHENGVAVYAAQIVHNTLAFKFSGSTNHKTVDTALARCRAIVQ